MAEEALRLFEIHGENFVNLIDGQFLLVVNRISNGDLFIFNDKVATKQLFYSEIGEKLYLSTDYRQLFLALYKDGIKPEVSRSSCYQLITLGYMLGENTIHERIKKLRPGSKLKSIWNKTEIKSYSQYNNEQKQILLKDSLDLIDKSLNDAIIDEFELDKSINKKHLITLSGGLDSRVVYYLALRNNYHNNVTFTYAANGSEDALISSSIAVENKEEFLLYNIDNCSPIINWKDSLKLNYGNIIYYGATGLTNVLKYLDTTVFGILHTGGLGEGGFGGYLRQPVHTHLGVGLFKSKSWLVDRFKDDFLLEYNRYSNDEMFTFYNRAINGMSNAFLIGNHYLETSSIFLNDRFLEIAFSIPPEFRYGRKLLEEYIIQKLPEAERIRVEKYGTRLTASRTAKFLQRVKRSVNYRILNKSESMNPFNFWYTRNKEFFSFVNNSFKDGLKFIPDKELVQDVSRLFSEDNINSKLHVIALLKALEYYKI
jgi:asparagine synthase (glutamine-hydrolysing)